MMGRWRIRVPFRIAIVGAIIGIVAIMAILACLIVYTRGEADARANAGLLFAEKSREVRERLDARLSALTMLASLGAEAPGLEREPGGNGLNHPALGFLFGAIEAEPSAYGAYAGWADGGFLMLINARGDPRINEANQAPPGCRYIVRAILGQGEGRVQRWSFLDANRRPMGSRVEPRPTYDPRMRDWYALASGDALTHLGKAYVFNSLKMPGITASCAFPGGVFGVDMTLSDLAAFLDRASPSSHGAILLLEDGRRLLAASEGAGAWLPARLPVLGDIAKFPIAAPGATPGGEIADAVGRTWLRERSDWSWGSDTRVSMVVMAPLSDFTSFFATIRATLLLLALMVLFVAVPIALWVSRQLSHPLSAISRDAERVSSMDFDGSSTQGSWIAEIDRLSIGYSRMKAALGANRRLVEAQRDSFARFVPERILALFDKSSVTEVGPRDCKALELSVMFSDIRSYTSISECLSCGDVFELLNSYFELTNPIITSQGGIIDKYIGDAIMSLFPISPDGALRAAIGISRALRGFNAERKTHSGAEIRTGTGIHFGTVEMGTVGDRTRLQATVIGDAVNLASRLESATKAFGVRVLVSQTAKDRLVSPDEFRLRQIDIVRVKGKEEPIGIYEAFDLDDPEVAAGKERLGTEFAEALREYRVGDFKRALGLFESCAAECPEDTVSAAYVKRCATLIRIPPGNDWAGVSTL
jgi:class 3 adenylate cyclase